MSMMKVLTATTAFVAVAAASNAAVITTSQTAVIYTSESTTATQIRGNGVIVGTADTVSASVEISGSTTAKNTVEVSNGATLAGNSATRAVIEAMSANNPGAEALITVSGTLTNAGLNGKAIDLSLMTTSSTVDVYGTVSGSVVTTEGATGDLLRVSGTGVINGNVTTGAGTDVIRISNTGVINGNVSTGADNDTVTLDGGRISGTLTLGAGDDVVNLRGGLVNGVIDGGADSDVINLTTGSYTTGGNINDVETLNIANGSIFTMNHEFNNTIALNVNGRLNLNKGAENSGAVALASTGTLDLGSHALTATTGSFAAGSNVRTTISDSTNIGRLIFSGDNINDVNNTSLTVTLGANAGYIANGTSKTIFVGNAANTATPTLLTTQAGVYTFTVSTTGTNGDISLTINRANTATLVSSDAAKAVAGVIETVSSSSTGQILAMQNAINQQTTTAGVNRVVESFAPAVDTGAAITTVNVGVGVGNNVSTRLSSLRSSGMATGDYTSTGHMWVQGFGATGEQDDKDGNRGYDATTAGASFGIDTDTLVDGATVGAAFSYGNSTVDSNASSQAATDINSYIGTLYGSRVYDTGMFLNGQASFGVNENETERQAIGFGSKTTGEYTSYQYGAKLETGRDLAIGNAVLTPLGSLQYTYLQGDEFTETGPTAARVDVDSFSALDAGVGANLGWNLPLEGGATLRPSVRAKYVYRMGDTQGETTSRFVAGGPAFATSGVEADRSSVNLGAGLLLASSGATELSLDYDADIRSSYTGHTGQVKLRWAF